MYIYNPGSMGGHYTYVANCCAWNWGAAAYGRVWANPKTLTIHKNDSVLTWNPGSTIPRTKISFPNFTIYGNVDLVKEAETKETGLKDVEWATCVAESPAVEQVLEAVRKYGVVVIAGTDEQDYVLEDYAKYAWISSFRAERLNESSGNRCILWVLIRGNDFEHSVVEDVPPGRLSGSRL